MKILRACIENFRLLKAIDVEFATSKGQNLTVIRAANESGKTTLLTALQWGLFGDDALPKGGEEYRLSPLDASSGERTVVNVTVAIDYEIPTRTGSRTYRLSRSVIETVRGGDWRRESTNLSLFSLSPTGAQQIENPETQIRPHFPRELREIFFTDGDRALTFIEGNRGDQVKHVEGAIRSLLGFGVIEEALNHLRVVKQQINQRIRQEAGNEGDLEAVTSRFSELQECILRLEDDCRQTKENRVSLEDLERDTDAKYAEAVRRGNREELESERQAAIQGRKAAERDAVQAARDHANLFRSELLGRQLLARPFGIAKVILDELHGQGKIPNQTIPVLEDRLTQPTCICGEELDASEPDGRRRREHIQQLIEDSRNADAVQEKITELYYGAQKLLRPAEGRTWIDEYSDVFRRRQGANSRRQECGEAESQADAKIAQLPDVDIRELKVARDHYRKQAKDYYSKEVRLCAQLETAQRELRDVERRQKKLLQQNEQGRQFAAELDVARDLQGIMAGALETMKTRELLQVSNYMNSLFLQMIGADAGAEKDGLQRSIITRAEITSEFRIVVFGRHEQPLDPSQDLNGASRRALTIAFVLALTKVSEVEAPNVIDTPLGMTSGYVKTAILQLAAQQSFQLILFLTHDEIGGCEDILDQYAGRVYTLTNPTHFPRILVNDPGVDDAGVLLCGCDHHGHCMICDRREAIGVGSSPG